MARFIRSRARLLVLFAALFLPLVAVDLPAEAQRSGVTSRRARARALARRQRLRERRQRRAEMVRARRQRIRERRQRLRERRVARRARRRGQRVAMAEPAAADMDFTAEASISPETENEAPPPMDMSYVEEAEQAERQARLENLDPELYGDVTGEGIADDELASPAAAPRERSRFSPLTARFTVGALNRGMSYSGYERGALTPYALPLGATMGLGADWYPGAHVTNDALAHLGFHWRFENTLGVESVGPNDVSYPTNGYAWQIGARYRGVLDDAGSEIVAELDVGQQGYHVDRGDLANPAPEGVPGVDYTQLRVGASGRWVIDDVALGARAAYLPVFDAGPIGGALGGAEVHGVEGALSFAYRLPAGFSVFGEVDTRVYVLGFDPAEDAEIVATGAVDHYVGGRLGLEWRMPADSQL